MRRNILFICTQNRLRSPTAEQVFADWPGVETASAGLGNDAEVPVSPELLAWADMIFVMEKAHRNRLSAKFAPEALDPLDADPAGMLSDIHGSAAYRAALVKVTAKRAVAALG